MCTSIVRKHSIALSIFFGIGFIQGLYLAFVHPPLQWFDSAIYDGTAWNVVRGLGFFVDPNNPDVYREPGYALFLLSPLYLIFGHSLLVVQIAQIIMSACTGVLIFVLGKRYFTSTVGLVGAIIYGVYPGVIAASGEILTETFFTFLLTFLFVVIAHAIHRKSVGLLAVSGGLLGITTLTRFVTLLLPIVVAVIVGIRWRHSKRTFLGLALFFLIFVAALSPWFIRNYRLFDHFILGRTGGGEIYWTATYVPWDGDWQGYIWPLTEYREGKNTFEHDANMTRLALQNITTDPFGVAIIWFKKPLKIFFQPEGLPFLFHAGAFTKGHELLTLLAILAFFGHLFIMFCVGLGCLRLPRNIFTPLFISIAVYVVIIHLPLNAVPRYGVPLYPLLFLVAGRGLVELFSDARRHRRVTAM